MLSFTSANPVVVTQNGVTTTYNLWVVTNHLTRLNSDGSISLVLQFTLTNAGGSPSPVPVVTLQVPNLLSDSVTGVATANFFTALLNKAVASGTIS